MSGEAEPFPLMHPLAAPLDQSADAMEPQVIVQVRQRPIPADLVEGDYQSDRSFRARFQQWMNGVWQDKDTDLDRLLGQRQD